MNTASNKQYFSIVIVSKGRHNSLLKTVEAVHEQIIRHKDVEILVIEETNTPKSSELDNVRYIKIPKINVGIGFVRQLASEMTKGSISIFIDDDVIPYQGWFENIIEPFNDQNIGAVGGAILPDIFKINLIGKSISILGFPAGGMRRFIKADGRIGETNLISTGNCAFRTELAREIGGFDRVFKWGGEDQEFFLRLSQKAKTLYNPHAIVLHEQRNSFKKVFNWFVRRGKAEFFMKCKYANPLYALFFPVRSNFILKLFLFFISFLLTLRISIFFALSLLVTVGLVWNYILLARLYWPLKNNKHHQLPSIAENINSSLISGNVKHRFSRNEKSKYHINL